MRRTVQILACLLLSLGWQPVSSWAQEPVLDAANAFVTRWQGEAGKDIQVPLYGSYAYRWEKADGTEVKAGVATVADEGLLELPVAEAGEYVLKAGPAGVKRIGFGVWSGWYGSSRGTPKALLRVEQWGSVAWESFAGAFYGCNNMNIADGAGKPDLSGVASMQSAFSYCRSFNSPIGDWDVSKVENMGYMFWECSAFNQPLGAWDVSKVTDMVRMFEGCVAFNQPLEKWDVSKVTHMWNMLNECSAFNQPLGGWTLSALKRDEKLDHDLGLTRSGLDVANYSATLAGWAAKRDQLQSGVRVRAEGLWHNATGEAARQQLMDDKGWSFSGDYLLAPIAPLDAANAFITRWQGTAGETIGVPLYGQYSYEWVRVDGGAVVASGEVRVGETHLLELAVPADGEYVLKAGPVGVKRIEFGVRGGDWYGSSRGTPGALLRVAQWGSVAWESFAGAFYECENMNIAEGAGKPDLSGVTSMHSAFWGCASFNSPIGAWDVSRVTSMREMFLYCYAFNQPLEDWDVSKVENMVWMFYDCESFNQPLEKWNVSNVTNMYGMFYGCKSFNQPLGGWTLSGLKRDEERDHDLGLGVSGLDMANYLSTLTAWAAKRDQLQGGVRVDARGLFFDAAGKSARQQLVDGKGWEFIGDDQLAPIAPLDAANAFITRWQGEAGKPIRVPLYGQYSYEWIRVDGGAVVASGEVRVGETRLLELAVPADGEYVLKAGPGGVKRIEFGVRVGEWYGISRGTPWALLRVEQWGRVAWESFAGAFYGCANMNVAGGAGKPDLSGVTSMHSAFERCGSFNSPIGDWDVSKVTSMREMFDRCSSFNQPLGAWDVSKVTDMSWMFIGCSAFNQPLEQWDVSKVKDMGGMFRNCSTFNQPLGAWDVSRVTDMVEIFANCYSFNQPLGNWTLSALMRNKEKGYDLDLSLRRSGLDVSNYSATLVAWAAKRDQLNGGVVVDAVGLKYNAAGKSARQQLIDGKAWVFKDDSEATVASPAVEIVDAPTWLAVGATHAFSAKVVPAEANQAVTWSVEGDGAEFTGSQLKVTKEGTIAVTATSVAAPTSSRSVTIRVIAPVALTGITVSPASVQIGVGGTQALTVGYTPADATNRAVTWSSSDEDVATVDATGVVTAKGKGSATITVKADDGGHRATCLVTVVTPVALTGITVMPTSAQLKVGLTQQLALGYTPADATNRAVTWSSSDASVATVDAQGKVTGVKAGTATITATSADGGHTATCEVTVVADEKPSGVESVALAGVSVSPNPFGDHLTVRGAEGVLRYSLVSATGVVELEGAHAGGDELGLSTSHLPTGIYWLRLVAEDGERVVQVVRR